MKLTATLLALGILATSLPQAALGQAAPTRSVTAIPHAQSACDFAVNLGARLHFRGDRGLITNGTAYNLSTDGGATYCPVTAPGGSNDVEAVHVAHDGNLFVFTDEQHYRSADDGATWTQLTDLPSGANAAVVTSSANGSLVASLGSGFLAQVWSSTDGGVSWTRNRDIEGYGSFLPDGRYVYVGSDGMYAADLTAGGAGSRIGDKPGSTVYAFAMADATRGYAIATVSGGLAAFRTDDAASSWTQLGTLSGAQVARVFNSPRIIVQPVGREGFVQYEDWEGTNDGYVRYAEATGTLEQILPVIPDSLRDGRAPTTKTGGLHAFTLDDVLWKPYNSLLSRITDAASGAPAAPVETVAASPNPTAGEVWLGDWPAGTRVRVADGLGRTVAAGRLAAGAFDLAGLPPGCYVLALRDGARRGVARVQVLR